MTWGRPPYKPPPVYQGCLRKEPLEEWEARLKAKRLRKKGAEKATYYLCLDCGKWHVTGGRNKTK